LKTSKTIFLLSLVAVLSGCNSGSENKSSVGFEKYKVADGFELQLAASEPLIEAPVTMDFDNKGRMWVVEMRGFTPDLVGTSEDKPNGRITILEDTDQNGVAESSKVFLDSLVLPRALSHVYGGLLYAVPPNLYFVEINNDKPGKRTLVDSTYADGGNAESKPNGLMMGIDNWIYSAYSKFRYQLKDGNWVKEPTSFRGQWGISQDNFGRLYYNSNEIQISGDYVLPNTLIQNPYYKPKEAINIILTNNQFVHPIHPTTVNRGYEKGILDKDSLLVRVTAACGPLVYRGGQFPKEFNENVFICEPQGNLVKRNILTFESARTIATQAYNDHEFIASSDEAFRPVNLFNGPDGAMYIVDMHRGMVEHRAFATPYYRQGILEKKLDTVLTEGRIVRVKYKSKRLATVPDLTNTSPAALVDLLKSENGWIRERAQQLLIYNQQKAVVPALEKLAEDGKNPVTAIHALHTLDGLKSLSFDFLGKVAAIGIPMLSAHSLLLLQQFNTPGNVIPMANLANNLLGKNDSVINLYMAMALGPWAETSHETFLPILAKISKTYRGKAIYQEAVVSSLKGLETNFKTVITNANGVYDTTQLIAGILNVAIKNKQQGKMNPIFNHDAAPLDSRTNGLALFSSNCSGCHGRDGDGIEHLAPPLKGSEFVEGSTDRLAMILLNGLEGPVHINGQSYNFNGSMPNFGNNLTDIQIVDIITYLHNAYVTKHVKSPKEAMIKKLRTVKSGTLHEKNLLDMNDSTNISLK
jgi:mono/diheme cytochrome c family protein